MKKGNLDVFSELYSLTNQKIYFLALSITKNEQTALDVVQEVYLKIIKSLHTLRDDTYFIAWMNKITYNTSISIVSNKSNSFDSIDDHPDIEFDDPNSNPLNYIIKNIDKSIISQEIMNLSEKHRSVILLKYFEHLKIHEIAYILNCPEGTIKSRLNTAKRHLKDSLKKRHMYTSIMAFSFIIPLSISKTAKAAVIDQSSLIDLYLNITGSANIPSSNSIDFSNVNKSTFATKALITLIVPAFAATSALFYIINTKSVATISSVDYPNELTNKNVPINLKIKNPGNLDSLYALSPTGQKIDISSRTSEEYFFEAYTNGTYEIIVNPKKNAPEKHDLVIDFVDKEKPFINNYVNTDTELNISVDDNLSGVDFNNSYGLTKDGQTFKPLKISEADKIITFDLKNKDFFLILVDNIGNTSKYNISINTY